MDNKVVKNDSKGYGYNYASLSDIAKQGYEIPKMKVLNNGDSEYVYYYDKELKDWMQGAKIVVPEGKGMNKAQLYGSALTYARRYTTLLALSLVCDDDKTIEDIKADGTTKKVEMVTKEQIEKIKNLYDATNIAKMLQFFKISKLEELTYNQASSVIAKKEKPNETNQQS